MDKAQVIDAFWNSFGWEAYDESTVPEDAAIPRITYSVVTDSLGTPVMIPASLWDKSYSWERISKKSDEISRALEERTYTINGHVYSPTIPISDPNGRVFFTKGSPYAQRMQESSDDMIRRIYLNVDVEFFTAY